MADLRPEPTSRQIQLFCDYLEDNNYQSTLSELQLQRLLTAQETARAHGSPAASFSDSCERCDIPIEVGSLTLTQTLRYILHGVCPPCLRAVFTTLAIFHNTLSLFAHASPASLFRTALATAFSSGAYGVQDTCALCHRAFLLASISSQPLAFTYLAFGRCPTCASTRLLN